jgi:hypothetical protein
VINYSKYLFIISIPLIARMIKDLGSEIVIRRKALESN